MNGYALVFIILAGAGTDLEFDRRWWHVGCGYIIFLFSFFSWVEGMVLVWEAQVCIYFLGFLWDF